MNIKIAMVVLSGLLSLVVVLYIRDSNFFSTFSIFCTLSFFMDNFYYLIKKVLKEDNARRDY